MWKKIIFALCGVAFLCAGIYFVFFYNKAAYDEQDEQESIADNFLEYLKEKGKEEESEAGGVINIDVTQPDVTEPETNISAEETQKQTEPETLTPSTIEDGVKYIVTEAKYSDDAYYQRGGQTFTPDYAAGHLFCVLEYEKLGIRRGVYSGTWADRDTNLDRWITNLANPYMLLGYTSITIEGHNHTAQNLSFNAVKDAAIGDIFMLYSDGADGSEAGVYVYRVTDIYIMTRDLTRVALINDLTSHDSETCFITTCGRDNILVNKKKYYQDGKGGFGMGSMYESVAGYTSPAQLKETISETFMTSRYHDLVIEGHLIDKYTLTEYANGVLDREEQWKK